MGVSCCRQVSVENHLRRLRGHLSLRRWRRRKWEGRERHLRSDSEYGRLGRGVRGCAAAGDDLTIPAVRCQRVTMGREAGEGNIPCEVRRCGIKTARCGRGSVAPPRRRRGRFEGLLDGSGALPPDRVGGGHLECGACAQKREGGCGCGSLREYGSRDLILAEEMFVKMLQETAISPARRFLLCLSARRVRTQYRY